MSTLKLLVLSMDNTNYGSRSHEIRCAEKLAAQCDSLVCIAERQPQYPRGEQKPENMEILPMPINTGLSYRDYQRILEEGPFDVIFSTSISGAPIAARLHARHHWPWVAQILDIPMWRLKWEQWAQQWNPWIQAVHTANRIIVNAGVVKDDLQNLFLPLSSDHNDPYISIVHYGMNTELADKIPESKHPKYLIAASRHVFYKGFDLLLYAYKVYRETNPGDPKLDLVILGDGEENFKLQQIAQLIGINPIFHGAVTDEDKFFYLKNSVAAFSCEYADSIPQLFPLEAVYCQVPTLVNDMPITRELFEDHVAYADVFRTNELAAQMAYLPSVYPYYAGKQWILEHRTIQHHADGIMKMIEEVRK